MALVKGLRLEARFIHGSSELVTHVGVRVSVLIHHIIQYACIVVELAIEEGCGGEASIEVILGCS